MMRMSMCGAERGRDPSRYELGSRWRNNGASFWKSNEDEG